MHAEIHLDRQEEAASTTLVFNALYQIAEYEAPLQEDVDSFIEEAEKLLRSGANGHFPTAFVAQRGLLLNFSGLRRKRRVDSGSSSKRARCNNCSVCADNNHTHKDCPLGPLLADSQ